MYTYLVQITLLAGLDYGFLSEMITRVSMVFADNVMDFLTDMFMLFGDEILDWYLVGWRVGIFWS